MRFKTHASTRRRSRRSGRGGRRRFFGFAAGALLLRAGRFFGRREGSLGGSRGPSIFAVLLHRLGTRRLVVKYLRRLARARVITLVKQHKRVFVFVLEIAKAGMQLLEL